MTEEKNNKQEEPSLAEELGVYELGYHIMPNVLEDKLSAEVEALKNILETSKVFFIGEEAYPKLIKLAYHMDKFVDNKKFTFDTAYFGWLKFESSPEFVSGINEALKNMKTVLRFLLIKSVRGSKVFAKEPRLSHLNTNPSEKKTKAEVKSGPISEEQVDQAIEELVVE